jgi:hypothetical protein
MVYVGSAQLDVDEHVPMIFVEPMGDFRLPKPFEVIPPAWRVQAIISNVVYVVYASDKCFSLRSL